MGELGHDVMTSGADAQQIAQQVVSGKVKTLCDSQLSSFSANQSKTIYLSDYLQNFDVLFVMFSPGDTTNIFNLMSNGSSIAGSARSAELFVRQNGSNYILAYSGYNGSAPSIRTLSGNTLTVMAYSASNVTVITKVYGLKF